MNINNNIVRILILCSLILGVSTNDGQAAETGSISVTVTVKVVGQIADVRIRLLPRNRRGRPGETVSLRARIENRGNGDDYFKLTASSSSGWTVEFPQGDIVGPLSPGARKIVPVTVTVPPDAGRGDRDRVTIRCTSQFDPSISDSSFSFIIAR